MFSFFHSTSLAFAKILCYNIINSYVYDAWGNVLRITDVSGNDISLTADHIANKNPFRFRGYYYDVETNLYYLNARYYDPETGRFISKDDVDYLEPDSVNGYNLFAYCANNPVMYSDPSGHEWWNWESIANALDSFFTKIKLSIDAFLDCFEISGGIGAGIGAEINAGPFNFSFVESINVLAFSSQESWIFGAATNVGASIGWKNLKLGAHVSEFFPLWQGFNSFEPIPKAKASIDIGFGMYFMIGFNFNLSLDLSFIEKLITIWS